MPLTIAKSSIVELVQELIEGNRYTWIMFGVIFLIIVGMAVYQKATGSKVFSKEARREGRRRRKHVLWEYERDKKD
ncbi:MAG: hypothetical protein ACYC0X_20040 [Pirellulaceae bacterium]